MFTLTGSKNSKIVEMGHDRLPMHGRGSCYSRQDADRLFRKLVIDGVLCEELKITMADHTACYIKLGKKAQDVITGKLKVRRDVYFILIYFSSIVKQAILCLCKSRSNPFLEPTSAKQL